MPDQDVLETDAADDTAAADVSTDTGADVAADADADAAKDWKAEHAAQQKINRDLERKTKRDLARIAAQDAELEKLRKAAPADADKPDLDAIRAEAKAEADAKANDRILKAEARRLATGKLENPAIALRLLDLTDFEVDADGNVDEQAITDAIADLLQENPGLAAQGGKRFQGSADGGTRKETRPSQLTKADLAGMSPEAIDKAHNDGRLSDLMSGK